MYTQGLRAVTVAWLISLAELLCLVLAEVTR